MAVDARRILNNLGTLAARCDANRDELHRAHHADMMFCVPGLRFFRTYVGLLKHKFGATTSTYLPTYHPPRLWPQKNLPTYLKVTAFTN